MIEQPAIGIFTDLGWKNRNCISERFGHCDASGRETQDVKKVAKGLLETLKDEKLVLDWRKRQQSRASVRLSIEVVLDKVTQSLH